MPRYLQKLVARAGVAPFTPSLQPSLRARGAEADVPDPLPEIVEPLFPATPAAFEDKQNIAPVVAARETSVHTIDFRSESVVPAPQVIRERTTERIFENHFEPAPTPNAAPEVHHAIRVSAQPESKEAPAQNAKPQPPKTTEKHSPERDVLSKLMPQLEAWFNQPSRAEKEAESPVADARLNPPLREPEVAPSVRQEESRLVIGQIRVDVLPAPPPAPVPSPRVVRVPIRSGQSSAVAETIGKLGFGLGQM